MTNKSIQKSCSQLYHTVKNKYGHYFFNSAPKQQIKVEGFEKRHCEKIKKALEMNNMLNGAHPTAHVLFPGTTPVDLNVSEHTNFRGFPLKNVFLSRQASDGGIMCVPSSLGQNIMEEHNLNQQPFSMKKYLSHINRGLEVLGHLTGMTYYRSYTSSTEVAFAFGAGKCGQYGAIAIEQLDIAGCQLIESLYEHAIGKGDDSQVLGLLYQQEKGAPFIPFSRQKGTTVLTKENGYLNLHRGYNIHNPFYVPLSQFLCANEKQEPIHAIHRHDHDTMMAAIEFNQAYQLFMKSQSQDAEQRIKAQELLEQTYQKIINTEQRFRSYINSCIKNQQADGNPLMMEVSFLPELNLYQANRWFFSTYCYSIGQYKNPEDQSPSLENIDEKGQFIFNVPQVANKPHQIVIKESEILKMLPAPFLCAFNLLSNGQLRKEDIPEPISRLLSTLAIKKLKADKQNNLCDFVHSTLSGAEIQQRSDSHLITTETQHQTLFKV